MNTCNSMVVTFLTREFAFNHFVFCKNMRRKKIAVYVHHQEHRLSGYAHSDFIINTTLKASRASVHKLGHAVCLYGGTTKSYVCNCEAVPHKKPRAVLAQSLLEIPE